MKTAAQLDNAQFIKLYNDVNISNSQLMNKLQCTWDVIRSKIRNSAVSPHLTATRTGGAMGTVTFNSASMTTAPVETTSTTQDQTVAQETTQQTQEQVTHDSTSNVQMESATQQTQEQQSTTQQDANQAVAGSGVNLVANTPATATTTAQSSFKITMKYASVTTVIEGADKKEVATKFISAIAATGIKNLSIKDSNNRAITDLNTLENGKTYTIRDQQRGA